MKNLNCHFQNQYIASCCSSLQDHHLHRNADDATTALLAAHINILFTVIFILVGAAAEVTTARTDSKLLVGAGPYQNRCTFHIIIIIFFFFIIIIIIITIIIIIDVVVVIIIIHVDRYAQGNTSMATTGLLFFKLCSCG